MGLQFVRQKVCYLFCAISFTFCVTHVGESGVLVTTFASRALTKSPTLAVATVTK